MSVVDDLDRPLRASEIFAAAMRAFGSRVLASLGLGAFVAVGIVASLALPPVVRIVVFAGVFTVAFALAARMVAGDGVRAASRQVARRAEVLPALGFVVVVPFAIGLASPVLAIVSAAWLALVGSAVPVAMVELEPGEGTWLGRVSAVFRRAVELGRAGYLHSAGVTVALVAAYWIFAIVLSSLLVGFADNGRGAAFILAQVVLAPVLLFGLSVLYFDQRARVAQEPPGQTSPAA
jgi:hypothetical protein